MNTVYKPKQRKVRKEREQKSKRYTERETEIERKERGIWACFPNAIKCRKPGRLNVYPRAPALTINPLLTLCVYVCVGVCRQGTERSQRSDTVLFTPIPSLGLQCISHCYNPIQTAVLPYAFPITQIFDSTSCR